MKQPIIKLMTFCLLVSSVFLANGTNRTWKERHNFMAITMDDGLPHNFVDDLLMDSRGFLWIATSGGGIARYEGKGFTYFNITTPSGQLKSNFIKKTCEDPFGRLWLISEGGIDIINIHSLLLTQPEDKTGKWTTFSHQSGYYLFRSIEGNIWLGKSNKLYKISFDKTGAIISITLVCNVPAGKIVTAIYELDGYLWFNYGNEIRKVKETVNKKVIPEVISPKLNFGHDIYISAIRMKENEIWIGSDIGLFRFSRNLDELRHYTYSTKNKYSLSQNFITDLAETKEHTLIASTLLGINIYNPLTDNFERICYTEKNNKNILQQNTLNNNFVNCMLVTGNVIWIGTEAGGLNCITESRLPIHNYMHIEGLTGSLSPNPVNAIYEEKDGTLWVGTVEGGLNRRSPQKDFFTHFTTAAPSMLSHNSVSGLDADDKGRLWIATWGGGIGWMELKKPGMFHHIIAGNPNFAGAFVGAIACDSINKLVWIGTRNGIFTYNPETCVLSNPFRTCKLNIRGCLGWCLDHKQNLWLGTSTGLLCIDLHSFHKGKLKYHLYAYKLDNPSSKLLEKVIAICESKDGTIWVGSNGYGLYRSFGYKDGFYQFKVYTSDDGLVNNSVRGVVEDDNGNIWIPTNNGISCLNPHTESFHNFSTKEGFNCNQFYWNATYKGHDGKLYFGNLNGLSEVTPSSDFGERKPAILAFTHLYVLDKERALDNKGILKMHEKEKSLNIEFVALDYEAPEGAIFSYRLLGFDNKWTKTSSSRHFVNYTNLPAGHYTFQLRYASDGIHWQQKTLNLSVIVSPYFYKTFWFISIMGIIILFIIYRIYSWRINMYKRMQKTLNIMVEQRTCELEEQKKLLTDQASELYRKNELLTQQNEKITQQKTQLIDMSTKIQKLTVDKISFFTNITHEFRTPLTLIIGPIERALKLSCNPQVMEQLHFVERNSKYLLSLINQLMDFRKVESGKMEISLNAGNLQTTLDELLTPFIAYAKERNIRLVKFIRLSRTNFMYDANALHKIFVNLLSNAFKFTTQGGLVSVFVSTYQHNGKCGVFIAIKDNGCGIPKQDLERIFQSFYQSKNDSQVSITGQSGTGIGLYVCWQIVRLYGGHIKAKNNRTGSGSSFRLTLPLQPAETDKQEIKPTVQTPTALHSTSLFNSKMTILVVEDNKDMRNYIRSILSEYYNVEEASQGEEALSVLYNKNIDFIISDLMMPIMDGLEFSKHVKADFSISHIPILMLTAKTSNETRIDSYKIGVDDYLLKPFDDQLLLARIANILEIRKRYQKKFSYHMDAAELNMDEESSDNKFLNKAIQTVKENYKNSSYEVSIFIEDMGMSKSLLNKKMQTLTGQSAGQFIRSFRLNIARELLLKNKETHNMNISEIAYEVGFNDPKYFTRCFTRHFNVTPSSLLDGDNNIHSFEE